MIKKFFLYLPTLSIVAICLNISFFMPASASSYIHGAEYWTAEELAKIDNDYVLELSKKCNLSDIECINEDYFNRHFDQDTGEWIEETAEESALFQFRGGGQFYITSINPSTGEVRALYHNRFWNTGESPLQHYDLDRFELFWADDSSSYSKIHSYIRDIKNEDSSTGTHVIYFGNSAANGDDWFASDRELILPVVEPLKIREEYNRFYFYADASQDGEIKSSIIGMHDLNTCLADYEDGMECRLIFSPELGMDYYALPVDNTKTYYKLPYESLYAHKTTSGIETDDETNASAVGNGDNTQPSDDETSGEDFDNYGEKLEKPLTTSLEQEVAETAKEEGALNGKEIIENNFMSPNTGAKQIGVNYSTEPEWWLKAIFIFGGIVILWFFWPKKSKKSEKKY